MNIVSYSLFVINLIYLLTNLTQMPATIPTHVNGAGEIDGWGSKWTLIILPIITIFTTLLMEFFEKNPHISNYPERLTAENYEQFYLANRKTINYIKNICSILFSYLMYLIVLLANEVSTSISRLVFIGLIVWMFAVIIYQFIQIQKIK
jgi:uncharacterized membrane protein